MNRYCALFVCACAISAQRASPVTATGLYDDFPSFFSARDTSRTTIVVRQSEIDLMSGRASVLSGEAAFGLGRRYEVRFGIPFSVLRRDQAIDFGVGDMTLWGTVVLLGDSLSARALALRADARFPTASRDFFPFSADSIVLGWGLKVRARLAFVAVRGAALYTMASDRRRDGALIDGDHLTVAASIASPITPRTELAVSAFVVKWDAGGSREVALAALRQKLSPSVELELGAAFETGASSARVFDQAFSIALHYRFPPRPRPSQPQSGTP